MPEGKEMLRDIDILPFPHNNTSAVNPRLIPARLPNDYAAIRCWSRLMHDRFEMLQCKMKNANDAK